MITNYISVIYPTYIFISNFYIDDFYHHILKQQHDDHYCILDSASIYYDEKKESQFLERVFALTFTSIIFFKKKLSHVFHFK